MRKINFFGLMLCMLIVSSSFIGCSKDDDDKVGNPFIGTWRDSAYMGKDGKPDGSWKQYTFNNSNIFQDHYYDGPLGASTIKEGTYDYSEATGTMTLVYKYNRTTNKPIENETEVFRYTIANSTTLVIGSYTYFKQ